MYMFYETSHLFLKILTPSASKEVLDFYERNKEFLEPYEPDRVSLFYTDSFQKSNLNYEYNEIMKRHMIRYWIYEKQCPNKIIGSVCLQHIVRGAFLSGIIGYKMDKDYLHKGYAFEALSYIIQISFEEYTLHRIEAYILPDNTASLNLIKKLNFILEGTAYSSVFIGGVWKDQLRYSFINNRAGGK